jgi:hypothetical protein
VEKVLCFAVFLKWWALPPKPPEAQVQGWFLTKLARALGLVVVPVVFGGVRAVDGLRFSLFYFFKIFIYINKLLYFFMN